MKIIHRTNLMAALIRAIKIQERTEKRLKYTGESALLAGWRIIYKALDDGEEVRVSQD